VTQTALGPLNRRLIIELHIGHPAEIQRNTVEHSRIDDGTRAGGSFGGCRHENTAFAAQHELCGFVFEAVVPDPGSITNLEFDLARRVRSAHHSMAPTEGTAVVTQRPVRGFDGRTIDDFQKSAMATASIFFHQDSRRAHSPRVAHRNKNCLLCSRFSAAGAEILYVCNGEVKYHLCRQRSDRNWSKKRLHE
jgi:hypothetical protein